MKVKVSKQFQMMVLIDLQVWNTKTFDVGLMDVRVIDDIQTLLFDLSLPIDRNPVTPMVLIVTVRQRTSLNSREILHWLTKQTITDCSTQWWRFHCDCRRDVERNNNLCSCRWRRMSTRWDICSDFGAPDWESLGLDRALVDSDSPRKSTSPNRRRETQVHHRSKSRHIPIAVAQWHWTRWDYHCWPRIDSKASYICFSNKFHQRPVRHWAEKAMRNVRSSSREISSSASQQEDEYLSLLVSIRRLEKNRSQWQTNQYFDESFGYIHTERKEWEDIPKTFVSFNRADSVLF